jgi:IPT/TIG domain
VTTDPAGDIYVGANDGNVYVWSPTPTTLYGTTVPADTLTSLTPGGVGYTYSLDYNDGNLWISDSAAGLQVLSPTNTTLYGVSVPADTPTTIVQATNSTNPTQVTFDSNGDLFFADSSTTAGGGLIRVDPATTGTLYGKSVIADQLRTLVGPLNQPDGIALDSSGDLFYADDSLDYIGVLPESTGTIFGQSVSADSATELFGGVIGPQSSNGLDPEELAFDSSGNLYFANLYSGIGIIANSAGTYLDSQVTADQPTNLNLELDPNGLAFTSTGELLVVDNSDATIVSATDPTANVTGVSVSGSLDNPTFTITGTGFGTEPSTYTPGCSASGDNFTYSDFIISDTQQAWQAGMSGDCIGMNVVSWSTTQVVATFGSWYTDQLVAGNNQIHPGDTLYVDVQGAYDNGSVASVTSVVPDHGPASGGTTVTISGGGFTTATAVDFGGVSASFTVDSDSQITATSPSSSVGTVDVTVTTSFGTSQTSSADQFTFDPDVGSDYSCNVPSFGQESFPVEVSETPQPPASEDEGSSFEEDLSVQVTIPSSVINQFVVSGSQSLTIEGQTTIENGLSSPDGSASGAVNPNSESTTATNVPLTYAPIQNNALTYQTTYDPVTWQTGPGTGTVYLTPGDITIVVTVVGSNSQPTTSDWDCTPPSNEGALDQTTVDPPSSSPTFQVPGSTPPVQSGVTEGNDDGWSFTIANTSTTTVTGLQAQITVSDGGTPPTFDTTAISDSGTKNCTVTSPGVLTCTEGTLAADSADTLNVLVESSGLSEGTGVTGSASVTSTNAGSATDSLDQFSVVVVNNGVEASAVPGVALSSTSEKIGQAGAKVKLTLPKNKIKVAGPLDYGSANKVSPPVVGLTLESEPDSQEPSLCPQTGQGCTAADVIEAEGSFAAYVNPAHPIVAALQFYFGSSTPKGSVYMLEGNGNVVKLPACKQSNTGAWNTPCADGKLKSTGSAGKLSGNVTVFFLGNDPGFSLR